MTHVTTRTPRAPSRSGVVIASTFHPRLRVCNATRSSTFFGNLDGPDLSIAMAELTESTPTRLSLDDDWNLEHSAGNHYMLGPIRLVLPGGAGQK